MQIGTFKEGGETISLEWDGTDPMLIVGKEAGATLRRYFLDAVHAGEKCAFIGNVEEVLPYIPTNRVSRTVLYELDYDYPRSCNPFKKVPVKERSAVAQFLLDAFQAAYATDIATYQIDRLLRLGALAMMEIPDGTLHGLPFLFISDTYREKVMGHLKDNTALKRLWQHFNDLPSRERLDLTRSIMNRLEPLVTDPLYANVIGQPKGLVLKDTDILLVSLPEGHQAALIAGLLLSRLTGKVFIEHPYLFVGKGQPIIACRYLDELPSPLLTTMLGKAVLVAFRLGVKDTKTIGSQFEVLPQNTHVEELQPHHALVRLEETYEVSIPRHGYQRFPKSPRKIKDRSRSQYGKPREQVEERLAKFIANT